MSDSRNDGNKGGSTQPPRGSPGSDTPSHSKISAGTSVGNVGESPMPQAQPRPAGAAAPAQPASGQRPPGGERPQNAAASLRESAAEAAGQVQERAAEAAGQVQQRAAEAAGQVQQRAGEAYEDASAFARDTYERASSWASDAVEQGYDRLGNARVRSARRLGSARHSVQDYVAENPVMVGLVGLAAGLLIGALLPRTRREDKAFGEWSDDVRQHGLRYAQDVAQRGREYVQDAFSGDDARFGRHESEYSQGRGESGVNRH
jgi:ElaB/YqjD/DUF883 family membrane-anchored ribosome-binding protein